MSDLDQKMPLLKCEPCDVEMRLKRVATSENFLVIETVVLVCPKCGAARGRVMTPDRCDAYVQIG